MIFMKNIYGYSLIELSICLALIGIIMGSGLAIGNMGNAKSQSEITEAQLDEIEYAIQMFVNRYKRPPCPASLSVAENTVGFGVESLCSGALPVGVVAINAGTPEELWVGTVPTRSLGLSDAKMFDAWNGRISYAVPKSYAVIATPIKNANVIDLSKMIKINDQTNNQIFPQPIPTPSPFNNPVVYVLVSHGVDMRGSYNNIGVLKRDCNAPLPADTQLDIENCDHADVVAGNRDAIFRQMDVRTSKIASQHFHDFVRFKTRVQFGAAALN